MSSPRQIILLGSTGSIGTQAIDIVRRNPERFRVVGLGAGGGNVALLARQALELGAEVLGVANSSAAQDLRLACTAEAARRGLRAGDFRMPKILAGPQAMAELAAWPGSGDTTGSAPEGQAGEEAPEAGDVLVLNGVVGSLGLAPTLAALRAGRTLALANKESLVAGGSLVRAAARPGQIVPVDSEHSALAQCLRAGAAEEVRRLVLTASGGPFRGWAEAELTAVTPAQALAHPTWNMGPVVTINSATLVNKGLEVIEAHELFRIPYDRIEVMVHPQSVIHSMVEFTDGSTLAQASPPDMRLPISLALGWPLRVPAAAAAVAWTKAHTWELLPLDEQAFPAVRLAKQAGRIGRCRPAIYNAANEECVAAFVAHTLPFLGIVRTIERVLDEAPDFDEPGTVEDVLVAESWARRRARDIIASGVGKVA